MLKLLRLIFMINIQGYYMQFDVAIDHNVAAYMHIYVCVTRFAKRNFMHLSDFLILKICHSACV